MVEETISENLPLAQAIEIVARDEGDFRKAPTFHDAEVQALLAIGSDHSPLLLVLHPSRDYRA